MLETVKSIPPRASCSMFFGIVAELTAAEHLNLITAVRILLNLLCEFFGGALARSHLLVGMTEFQDSLGFHV